MQRTTPDPLLATTRTLLAIFIGLLWFAIVMVAIGVGAVLTVQRGELLAQIETAGLSPAAYWRIVGGLVALVALLFCALRFVTELRAIVASVDGGDPFVTENAGRLSRMAWLTVAIQLIGIPLGTLAAALSKLSEDSYTEFGTSGGGFALALTLLILARVFRKGAEMREELEGTV